MVMFSIECVGEEVILGTLAFGIALVLFGYYTIRSKRREQTEINQPRRRYSQQNECPVCRNDIKYEVETNCGHIFCCRCWLAYMAHMARGSFVGAVLCPVCRQQVTSLFQAFSKNKLNPVSASDEEPDLANFIREINSYNRRYSGEPKPFWENIRELPILFRRILSQVFSEGGFFYLYRLRAILSAIRCVMTLLSLLDIIPVAAFGLIGLVNDLLALLMVAVMFNTNVIRTNIANIFANFNNQPPEAYVMFGMLSQVLADFIALVARAFFFLLDSIPWTIIIP
ncbi:E3 ubiquitin-protein ligase RNF170-like [Daphnia pulex]|uniref:E3 ubiquitin-protein ligase RNF170-like n=1 Tax=Daphnia pulex TaxID=6669 RepID=UPI001EDDF330|nr:E3 ubiquitin-protein ligase RNF170-like [Daphnia pulex]